MADYKNIITKDGITRVELSVEEQSKVDANRADFASKSGERKLDIIKQLRLDRLQKTDWMGFDDVTMPENIKTWRQELRDIPQTYTTEAEYDLLLARDENKQLTHSVWSKP